MNTPRVIATIICTVSLPLVVACGGAASSAELSTAPEPRKGPAPYELHAAADGAGVGSTRASGVDVTDRAYLDDLMNRVFVLIREVTAAAASAGEDCQLMAERLEAWSRANQARLEALAVEVRQVPKATQRQYVENKLEAEPDVGMDFMVALSTCQDEPRTVAAWKNIAALVSE